jgi:hypothetical protein
VKCGKVFNLFSGYTGSNSIHNRKRPNLSRKPNKKESVDDDDDDDDDNNNNNNNNNNNSLLS